MFAKDTADIDHAIQHMMDAGFQLRVEDDAAGFQNANRKAAPAEVAELSVDMDGPGPQEHWSYASVVG
eukprot:13853878-Ditylum_brightwellii.AAC.1